MQNLIESLLWLMNRPQQALFRGAKKGSESFGDYMRAGQNPLLAALASTLSAGEGAYQGLTGGQPDVRGRELTEGLTGGGEWGKAHEKAMGNFLDLVASPMDVVAPVGRALRVPVAARAGLRRMPPELLDYVSKTLGSPSENIPKMVSRLLNSGKNAVDNIVGENLQPAFTAANRELNPKSYIEYIKGNIADDLSEALGKYGVWYGNVPKSIEDIDPLIIKTAGQRIPGWIQKRLDPNAIPISGLKGRYQNLWNKFEDFNRLVEDKYNAGGNVIWWAHGSPSTGPHEAGHYLRRLIGSGNIQPVKNRQFARDDFINTVDDKTYDLLTKQIPNKFGQFTPSALRKIAAKRVDETPNRLGKFLPEHKTVLETDYNYSPQNSPEELLVRSIAKQKLSSPFDFEREIKLHDNVDEWNAVVNTHPVVQAMREMINRQNSPYLPAHAYRTPAMVPTNSMSELRRLWEKYNPVESKDIQ